MRAIRSILFLSALLAVLQLAGCVSVPLSTSNRGQYMHVETLVKPDCFWTSEKVLLVDIDGILGASPSRGGLFAGPSMLVHLKDVLARAEEDDSVKALLLRIDSPGGSVTASDLLYTELKNFKKRTGKKIVAVFMGVAASGGYYMAMAADHIQAHPTTLTGSIGVIGIFPDLHGLSGKIGLDMRVIKSGNLKDIGSMWRSFETEEKKILQESVDVLHERFVEVVADGRPNLDKEAIRALANGRPYHAKLALELGLIDEIGYMGDAFEKAKSLADLSDAALVAYTESGEYRGHYYVSADAAMRAPAAPTTQINLLNLGMGEGGLFPQGGPFYYLWLP